MTVSIPGRERELMRQAQARVIDRVFCTACQAMQPPQGGGYKRTANGKKRFVCASCRARMDRSHKEAK